MKFFLCSKNFLNNLHKGSLLGLSILLFFNSCERLEEWGQNRAKERMSGNVDEKEIEIWKEKLGLQEAEIRALDEKIKEMVSKTKQAGSLSWRIAKAYLKVGNSEISTEYYQKAIDDQIHGVYEPSQSRPELHKFESAIPFFENALKNRTVDEDLLFETGLAYANASRDRGWDKERRSIAIQIFKGLMRRNPEDLRYPYELALIYFDSSVNDGIVEGTSDGYNDTQKAFQLLNYILERQEKENLFVDSVSTRFALANFHYRLGNVSEAVMHYKKIKSLLENFAEAGKIKNLAKNPSYINVTRNLQKIQNEYPSADQE